MDQLFEFVVNHPYHWVGLLVILAMLIRAEFEHQNNRSGQLAPMNAIRLINNNDDALIIDVRESAEFTKGHIGGAANYPVSTLKDKIEKLSKRKDSVVVAYCASGSASNKACRALTKAGFTNVYNIAGGLNAWLEAKLPTTTK